MALPVHICSSVDQIVLELLYASSAASTRGFDSCLQLEQCTIDTRSICGITCRRAGAPPEYYSLAGPRCDWQQIQQTVPNVPMISVASFMCASGRWSSIFGPGRLVPGWQVLLLVQEAAEANLQDARGCAGSTWQSLSFANCSSTQGAPEPICYDGKCCTHAVACMYTRLWHNIHIHPCAIERQTHPTSFHVGRWTT